jgi:hypothetical protein
VLEEAANDRQTEALSDLDEAGAIEQGLVKMVAKVPPVGEVELCVLHKVALRADALEEHHQLETEKDDRIDGGTSACGIEVGDPLTDEGEVEGGVEMAAKVIRGTSRSSATRTERSNSRSLGRPSMALGGLSGVEHPTSLLRLGRVPYDGRETT